MRAVSPLGLRLSVSPFDKMEYYLKYRSEELVNLLTFCFRRRTKGLRVKESMLFKS